MSVAEFLNDGRVDDAAREVQRLFDRTDPAAWEALDDGLERHALHPGMLKIAAGLPPRPARVDARTVLLFGNCQAELVAYLGRRIPLLASHYRFVIAPSTPMQSRPYAIDWDAVESTDIFWDQPTEHPGVEARRKAVTARLPSTCRTVRFPRVALMSVWPFSCNNAASTPEPGLPWGRYPFGDRVANEVRAMNLPAAEAFASYRRISAAKMPNLNRVFDRDLRVIEREDAEADFAIAPFVREMFTVAPLFCTWTEPANVLTAELLARLLTASGASDLDTPTAIEQLRIMLPSIPELIATCVPVDPIVARMLGLAFATPETRYGWFGHRWTFEEYMQRYLASDRDWIPLEGIEVETPVLG